MSGLGWADLSIVVLNLEYVWNSDFGEEIKVQRKKRCEKKIRILIGVWNSKPARKEKDKNSQTYYMFSGDEARRRTMMRRSRSMAVPVVGDSKLPAKSQTVVPFPSQEFLFSSHFLRESENPHFLDKTFLNFLKKK